MKKIIGIGNALVDILVSLKDEELLTRFDLPRGSMQLVDREVSTRIIEAAEGLEMNMASGGSAANTIHGLASLGMQTAYVGTVGNDSYGEFFRKDMGMQGILPLLIEGRQETGRAVVLVSPDSERTFATYLGAALELGADHIHQKMFSGYGLLHLEGYLVQNRELMESILQAARANGLTVSLDLASYNIVEQNREFLLEMISEYTGIVFANEEESRALTGEKPEKALAAIAGMCDIAVVKLGKMGSLVRAGIKEYKIRTRPVDPVDTTGAGDLYAAGFLYAYSEGMALPVCGSIGSLLAGNVIEVIGTKMDASVWECIRQEIRQMAR